MPEDRKDRREKMAKEAKTNAMRMLDRQKVKYEAFSYECDEFIDGVHSADKIGAPYDQSFKTLVMEGKSGGCIAHDLLESAHCVMYFSAFDLFELLADSKFSRDKTEGQEFVFDSDLLIIDDLGTELTNSFVSSQLFLCINERIMRRKSTIISTNLKLENFSDTYSERTFSRIASNYRMVKLEGKDIRIQKIFLGGK